MEPKALGADLSGVLKGALSLPEEDQRRLCEIMVRLTSGVPSTGAEPPSVEPSADGSQVGAAEWLQQIQGHPLWVQVQLLDDALASVEEPDELEVLREAQNRLLSENPPLAVRRAVVRLAVQHPVGMCAGAVGLLLAIAAAARGLFRLVF